MYEPIEVDGSRGEGGGQIVRTSAALCALTGRPLRLIRIRAGRTQPGLMAQHLTALKAVATLCGAEAEGLELGSSRVQLVPGALRAGRFSFRVSTAGSAGLVLQAILPLLLEAPGDCEVEIEGGTHVRHAPPFDHTEVALGSALRAMGAKVEFELDRAGFYPKGGGRMRIRTSPWRSVSPRPVSVSPRPVSVSPRPVSVSPRPVSLSPRPVSVSPRPVSVSPRPVSLSPRRLVRVGPLGAERSVRVYGSGLADHVFDRARRQIAGRRFAEEAAAPGVGVGFAVAFRVGDEVVTGLGERGVPVEQVVDLAGREADRLVRSGASVGPHLADQLLVLLARGAGGVFVTPELTSHFETQVGTLHQFFGPLVSTEPVQNGFRVEVQPAA